ncbi:dCTP deaminase [Lentzea sp. BCCO 10_0856]|uniref:dCTP deaminase n=1 Tax=Lentzea miocenica TaxID=3095431 RepID=A0ABU4TBG0_9PSEU|nr:dCTP deaminase [Lentzea sp. BCCO 10_0856]MDX8035510.1 dCTP deaminase [Lentzea sp. BCCO 10_0856]
MILTRSAIAKAVEAGEITITPFDAGRLNPNSYNYSLGEEIRFTTQKTLDAKANAPWLTTGIPDEGYLLRPGRLYLATTAEVIGSTTFVTSLIGRSSMGRLGLFVQVTADLGHQGAIHRWTLELTVVQPLRVYAGMRLGQVSFWRTSGTVTAYGGAYGDAMAPMPALPTSLT